MHEIGLVPWENELRDLVVRFGETQVEGLDSITILISDVIVLP
jgi:hypothetical protein